MFQRVGQEANVGGLALGEHQYLHSAENYEQESNALHYRQESTTQ